MAKISRASSLRGMSSFGEHGHGAAPGSVRRALSGGRGRNGKKPPPLMDPTRQRDGHRILALFKPYRGRLITVLVMIVFSSGLSMVSPFLLRAVLDKGIFHHEHTLLTELVLGMIGIAIANAAFNVWQTYISNAVGQRVMHDLRAAVYRRLQRMSLAFFTRTRTGEVQSRIANDIGGLDSVVTTTATTIAQNATTVIAALAAMCLLDWRLALLSLIFVPLFVWLTRLVGKVRRKITTEQQRRLGTCRRSSRSRCRSPGSCWARRWGGAPTWPSGSPASPRTSPTSRSAPGWPAAG
jgi:ATP-binding cassette subfamily B protein